MSMYKTFKTDDSLEKTGIFLDYGEFRVTIARAGGSNKRFAKVLEAKTKPYRRAIQTEMMDQERGATLLREVYAEAVVLNWEVRDGEDKDGNPKWRVGIELPDGTIGAFTKENVLLTFNNLPDLFSDIQEQAGKAALFRASIQEAEAGNS